MCSKRKNFQKRKGKGKEKERQTLSSCVPQGELDMLSIDLHIGNIVLKDSGNIVLRELSTNVDNQKTGLATGSISNNHKLALHISFSAHRCLKESREEGEEEEEEGKEGKGVFGKGLKAKGRSVGVRGKKNEIDIGLEKDFFVEN